MTDSTSNYNKRNEYINFAAFNQAGSISSLHAVTMQKLPCKYWTETISDGEPDDAMFSTMFDDIMYNNSVLEPESVCVTNATEKTETSTFRLD
jgi:hypothetical protein